jgi:hypothetical protein
LREHHGPRQVGIGRAAPQLAVDEIADAPEAQAQRHAGRDEIHHLPERLAARAREPHLRSDHAQQAAVEAHAALPHEQDLQRVGQVEVGLVEQAVAEAPAQDGAEHAEEQHVLHVFAAPRARPWMEAKGSCFSRR